VFYSFTQKKKIVLWVPILRSPSAAAAADVVVVIVIAVIVGEVDLLSGQQYRREMTVKLYDTYLFRCSPG